MPVPNDSIDTFLDALWLEEGLARSTLDAYRRDLTLYAAWLADPRRGARGLDESTEDDLHGYAAERLATTCLLYTSPSPRD